ATRSADLLGGHRPLHLDCDRRVPAAVAARLTHRSDHRVAGGVIVVGPFAEGQQIEIQSLRTTGFMSRQPYAYHTVAGRHVATVGRRHPRAAPHDRAAHNRGPAGNARSAPRRLAAPAGYPEDSCRTPFGHTAGHTAADANVCLLGTRRDVL